MKKIEDISFDDEFLEEFMLEHKEQLDEIRRELEKLEKNKKIQRLYKKYLKRKRQGDTNE